MRLPLSLTIALRYIRSPRDFLSGVASLAILGLALSIAILLVTQAVLSGFDYEMRERVLGLLPHVSIYSQEDEFDISSVETAISRFDEVVAGAPMIEGVAVLVVPPRQDDVIGIGKTQGIVVKGIDANQFAEVSDLFKYIAQDRIDLLQARSYAVMIGSGLAKSLGVEEGDYVTIALMKPNYSLVGFIPRQKRVEVASVIDTETFMDSQTVFMHIDDARRLFQIKKDATSYKVRLTDPYEARSLALDMSLSFDEADVYAVSWFRAYGYLHQALVTSRIVLLLIFSLLVAVAAFNLVSTVVMLVTERQKDIAVLRTIGSDQKLITRTFLISGLLIATVGLAVGCILGFALGLLIEIGIPWIEQAFNVDFLSQYFVQTLSVRFSAQDFLVVVGIGFVLCVVAIIYPAVRTARMNPAEVLRYD